MSSHSIDYNSLLSESDPPIGLPYDVTFLIFNREKELQGEVQGHKFIFAHNSSVFRTKFCGAGDFADKIDKEVEAFQLITNFLYNKPTAIDELSVDKIFYVVDLAHFYDITKLEEALEQRLEKLVIVKDDVIEAAKKAEEFARFEMASQALLKNCARTLQVALNDVKDFSEFSSQVAGTGDEVIGFRLFAMIKDLPPLPPIQPLDCSNFQKFPCVSGAVITNISQVRLGTRLALNIRYWAQGPGLGRTEVVSVNASVGRVKVKAGDGTDKFDTDLDYPVKNPRGVFCFAC